MLETWRLNVNSCGSDSGGSQRKPTTPKKEDKCSISVVVGSGSQRKPTSTEIEHECLISVLVGDGQWIVIVVAARGSLQALKSSMNA